MDLLADTRLVLCRHHPRDPIQRGCLVVVVMDVCSSVGALSYVRWCCRGLLYSKVEQLGPQCWVGRRLQHRQAPQLRLHAGSTVSL